MIGVIAKREATALFRTPLAWSLLAMVQFVLAYQFLAQIETYLKFEDKLRTMPEAPGVTEVVVTPILGIAAMLLLFFVPILTMASISGERRNGTLPLLLSSPVTSRQIVLGKFFIWFTCIRVLVCELRRSWSDVFDAFYTTGRWGGDDVWIIEFFVAG
jgi:ABC-2 type transport system permease protein